MSDDGRLCKTEDEWSDIAFAMENGPGRSDEQAVASKIRYGCKWRDYAPFIQFTPKEIALIEAWRGVVVARNMPDW